MTDVLDDRAAIEASFTDRTLCTELLDTVTEHGDDAAYSDRHAEQGWRTLTWSQLREQALDGAAALVDAGIRPHDTVAFMASNRIEHVVADLAALHAGATPMSVYATLAPEQVDYIAGHAEVSVVVLEGDEQLDRWRLALQRDTIRVVVVLDEAARLDDARCVTWRDFLARGSSYRHSHEEECERRWRSVQPDDPATILYTSGTTGDPKGVVLTHRNVLFESYTSSLSTGFEQPGITISYLPFAHIAERMLGIYTPVIQGGHVHLLDDPAALVGTLLEVRPTRFFGVPRVWEKIQAGVSALMAAETDEARKAEVAAALDAGQRWVAASEAGGQPSAEVQQRFEEADRDVLRGLRAMLGLDRVEWAASAAAPMPIEVARFFAGLGIVIHDVYGMTETTGSVTANVPSAFRLGSVGRPQRGIELRIADDGEICVRGPVTTPGYHKAPEATAGLYDADGWVHTGDIGRLDDDGYLFVVDRKKEMIITSSGKNIAPSNIENYLKESPLVGHAYAHGDGRPYVVALLTLDPDVAPVVAQRLGLPDADLAALAERPEIRAIVAQAVEAANARLSRPEQVKRWELLAQQWTAESEELTPTLKLKRRVVQAKYQDVLERLYG
jgi:long-chain acyl-CoA synthetase